MYLYGIIFVLCFIFVIAIIQGYAYLLLQQEYDPDKKPTIKSTIKEAKKLFVKGQTRHFNKKEIVKTDNITKMLLRAYLKGHKYCFYKGQKFDVPEIWK